MATTNNRVLWQEGLFALPQHFQQQQRHTDYLLHERLDAQADFAWGFTELSLNTELLAQGKIMIDSASGTLPAGWHGISYSRSGFTAAAVSAGRADDAGEP